MTREEVIDLLTLIAARDNRTVGNGNVAAWVQDVGDLPFGDAQAAVARHFRESTEWLMPAHVRRLVKLIREERIAAVPEPAPPVDPKNEEAYRQALANIRRRIGDGRQPFRAIQGGYSEPSREFKAARTAEDRERVLAQTVDCPVGHCPASAGEPCRSGPDMPAMTRWHPSRLEVARGATA